MDLKIEKRGLVISVTDAEREQLRTAHENVHCYFGSNDFMEEFLEDLLDRSDFDWIKPEEVGALTDAPILGVREDLGKIRDVFWFSDYMFTSVQRELLMAGEAVFNKV